jgi:hypothetical protein
MEYLGGSLDCDAERDGRIVVTNRARDAIRCLCRAGGLQALVVAWPGDVTCPPVAPVYANLRQLGSFADRPAVLDLAESMRWPERPLLGLRSAPCGDSARAAPQAGVVTR